VNHRSEDCKRTQATPFHRPWQRVFDSGQNKAFGVLASRGGLCSHGQCAVDPIRSLQQQSHVRVLDVQGGHGVNGSGQLPKTVSNSQKANARPILKYRSRTQRSKTRHLQQPSPKSHLPASVARHPVVGPPNPLSAVTAPIWVEERDLYLPLLSSWTQNA